MSEESSKPIAPQANADARDRVAGRFSAGFVLVLNALLAWTNQGAAHPGSLIQPDFSDEPRTYFLATLLDKIGDAVGRGYCWIEAKLGLTPKQ